MINEVKSIEPQLKQILYGCVEHVQATKAALYLSASHDLNEKTYELVTSYQFNDSQRKVLKSNDDLVDRLAVKRNAFFVNGLGTDMRFSEMLFRQSTDRMLATPLFSRGRLVGFIDMRDKAGKKPFDNPDLEAARRISDEILALLSEKNLYGLAPIPLVPGEPSPRTPSSPNLVLPQVQPMTAMANTATTPAETRRSDLSPQATRAIEAAREFMSRRQITQTMGKRLISDADLEGARILLPAALAIPGAVLAAITVTRNVAEPQSVVAISTVTSDANDALQVHLRGWLQRANQPQTSPFIPHISYPFGAQSEAVTSLRFAAIASVPVVTHSIDGLVVLTLAFERPPDASVQRSIRLLLRQLEQSIDVAGSAAQRQIVVEKLLEPDFQKYPDLIEHCRQVSTIAHRFATAIDLPTSQAETIRIAALVHDVGLRLLDYERLYRRPKLTPEEMRAMAEHPIVGAAIVEPVLGNEIAQVVLRHHERVDGKGYPSRLAGNAIPLAARVIQLCDAWVAMTSRHSYQPPLTPEEAETKIREGAGTQFDEALTTRFLKLIGEL